MTSKASIIELSLSRLLTGALRNSIGFRKGGGDESGLTRQCFVPGADYHRGILAWLPEIWSMQQEAGVEGGEFDDENDINKSYHDLCVETA